MSISALDPRTALVVIDLQEGLRPMAANVSLTEIATRVAGLARVFRKHALPVVLVNVKAKEGRRPRRVDGDRPRPTPAPNSADLMPELNAQPSDIRITKHTWSAFYETGLHERLEELGVTEVVIVGVATSVGVEATARAAYEHGYNVTIAEDAVADRDQVAHDYSLTRVFPRIGQVGTVGEIAEVLERARLAPA